MSKIITRLGIVLSVLLISATSAQNTNFYVIDSFGDHKLSGWYWGGNLSMKYSHREDNIENGYGIITSTVPISANSFAGIIRKESKIQLTQDNILSIMLQGINNDLNVTVQILFDKNGDGKYEEKTDTRIESKTISLNYSGWKEVHFSINQSEFRIVSSSNEDDFSVLENEAVGLQLLYQAGKDYISGHFETGIAMIAERYNKEVKQEVAQTEIEEEESYFNSKNYPNPFNPETRITYTLKNPSSVKITVYDRLGREVQTLVDEFQPAGEHYAVFNASGLPSGVYFYRIKTSDRVEVRKMVYAK